MNSKKCTSCGLVNFADSENCKKCGFNLSENLSGTDSAMLIAEVITGVFWLLYLPYLFFVFTGGGFGNGEKRTARNFRRGNGGGLCNYYLLRSSRMD